MFHCLLDDSYLSPYTDIESDHPNTLTTHSTLSPPGSGSSTSSIEPPLNLLRKRVNPNAGRKPKPKLDLTLPLYAGCSHSINDAVTDIQRLHTTERVQRQVYEMLSKYIPLPHNVPSFSDVMRSHVRATLGDFLQIEVCEQECILYIDEYEHYERCPVCGKLRSSNNVCIINNI